MGTRLVLEGLRQAGEGIGAIGQGMAAADDRRMKQEQVEFLRAQQERENKLQDEALARELKDKQRLQDIRADVFSQESVRPREIEGPTMGGEPLTAEMQGPSLLAELQTMSGDPSTTREEFTAKAGEYLAQAAASGDPTTITAARSLVDTLEEPITVREGKAEKEAERLAKKDRTLINAKVKEQIAKNKREGKLSVGEEAVDKAFSKQYLDWEAGGGAAKLQSDLSKLDGVIAKLNDPNADVSGKIVGTTPEFLRGLFNPEAQDVQDNIRNVIQQTLRQTLGAQFTEKEGERVINATYNPKLPPEVNAQRIQSLFDQLQKTGRLKQAAVEYYRNNNFSLKGYRKPAEIEKEFLDALAPEEKGAKQPGSQQPGGQQPGGQQPGGQQPKLTVIDEAQFEKLRQNPNNQAAFLKAKQAKEQRLNRELTPQEAAEAEIRVLRNAGYTVKQTQP